MEARFRHKTDLYDSPNPEKGWGFESKMLGRMLYRAMARLL